MENVTVCVSFVADFQLRLIPNLHPQKTTRQIQKENLRDLKKRLSDTINVNRGISQTLNENSEISLIHQPTI